MIVKILSRSAPRSASLRTPGDYRESRVRGFHGYLTILDLGCSLVSELRPPSLEERRYTFAEIFRAGRRDECVAFGFELLIERHSLRLMDEALQGGLLLGQGTRSR